MKEKAKILLAGLVFLLMIVVMPREAMASQNGTFGDAITWELTEGVLTFTGSGTMKDDQRSYKELPWYDYQSEIEKAVIGEGITSIGWGTFYGCTNLKEVTLPSTLKSIGYYSFKSCRSLEQITLPNGLTEISSHAFEYCTALVNIVIPDSVQSIGSSVFEDCKSLKSVKLPAGLQQIPGGMFLNCPALTSITLPAGATELGGSLFEGCSALTSITIPESVTSLPGGSVFKNCTSLKEIYFSDALIMELSESNNLTGTPWLESINNNGFYIYKNILLGVNEEMVTGDITIPGIVHVIPDGMFTYNSEITSVVFSEGVKSIGQGAFDYCDNLVTVTFPKSLTSLGQGAFGYCEKLTTIYFGGGLQEVNNNENVSYARVFKNTPWLTKQLETNQLVILDGRIVIDSKLTGSTVVIPEGVVQISETAFVIGGYIRELSLPSTLKRIDRSAFANCYGFDVTIPASVEKIGAEAFGYKDDFKFSEKKYDITIYGTKGTAAETYAKENDLTFVDVNAVKPDEPTTEAPSTEVPGNDEPTTETPSTEAPSGNTGTTPAKGTKVVVSGVTYKITKAGKKNAAVEYVKPKKASATKITIPATVKVNGVTCKVTSIAANAFKGNKKITKVVIGKNVAKIGKQAFYGCKKLKTIEIKTTKLTKAKVGKNAFKGVKANATVKVPKAKKAAYKTILKARGITKVKIK